MTAAWRQDNLTDQLWLMYSANYLVRSAGVCWAIDPLTLANRLLILTTGHDQRWIGCGKFAAVR
jgi:hypothetical protein